MSHKPESQSAQLSTRSCMGLLTSDCAICPDAISLYPQLRAQTDRHGRYRAIISGRPALNEWMEVWHVVHDTCNPPTQTLPRTALSQGLQALLPQPV